MAKRFTDTEIWDKEWFMKLPCKLKCLVKFVRDKADLSGVWSPNWIIANTYIGEAVSEKELLEIDGGRQFKKIANGKIVCLGFIEFQYGKLSEKSPVHRKIIQILNTHKIPYQYPINRVQEEDKEEEREEEEKKESKSLTEIEAGQAYEYLYFLGRKDITRDDIPNYWQAFIKHKPDFDKENRGRQMQHFRDWLKFQKKQIVKDGNTIKRTDTANPNSGILRTAC